MAATRSQDQNRRSLGGPMWFYNFSLVETAGERMRRDPSPSVPFTSSITTRGRPSLIGKGRSLRPASDLEHLQRSQHLESTHILDDVQKMRISSRSPQTVQSGTRAETLLGAPRGQEARADFRLNHNDTGNPHDGNNTHGPHQDRRKATYISPPASSRPSPSMCSKRNRPDFQDHEAVTTAHNYTELTLKPASWKEVVGLVCTDPVGESKGWQERDSCVTYGHDGAGDDVDPNDDHDTAPQQTISSPPAARGVSPLPESSPRSPIRKRRKLSMATYPMRLFDVVQGMSRPETPTDSVDGEPAEDIPPEELLVGGPQSEELTAQIPSAEDSTVKLPPSQELLVKESLIADQAVHWQSNHEHLVQQQSAHDHLVQEHPVDGHPVAEHAVEEPTEEQQFEVTRVQEPPVADRLGISITLAVKDQLSEEPAEETSPLDDAAVSNAAEIGEAGEAQQAAHLFATTEEGLASSLLELAIEPDSVRGEAGMNPEGDTRSRQNTHPDEVSELEGAETIDAVSRIVDLPAPPLFLDNATTSAEASHSFLQDKNNNVLHHDNAITNPATPFIPGGDNTNTAGAAAVNTGPGSNADDQEGSVTVVVHQTTISKHAERIQPSPSFPPVMNTEKEQVVAIRNRQEEQPETNTQALTSNNSDTGPSTPVAVADTTSITTSAAPTTVEKVPKINAGKSQAVDPVAGVSDAIADPTTREFGHKACDRSTNIGKPRHNATGKKDKPPITQAVRSHSRPTKVSRAKRAPPDSKTDRRAGEKSRSHRTSRDTKTDAPARASNPRCRHPNVDEVATPKPTAYQAYRSQVLDRHPRSARGGYRGVSFARV